MKTIKFIAVSALLFSVSACARRAGDTRDIEIRKGMSARRISYLLEEENIISSSRFFLLYMKITGDAGNILAGVYRLRENMRFSSLRRKLTTGPNVLIRVSIPEGFTAEQIAARLYREGVIDSREEFMEYVLDRNLRGFLFPDTYDFFPGESIRSVAGKMRARFQAEFTDEYRSRAEELGMSVSEVITLASIIEREARVPEERTVISGVFHRRLRKRMYLESCATVQFALGEHRDRLTYADLEIDSPYNTYRRFGLPPTPICSPGSESIKAALYPDDSGYLFFFALEDGSHEFSKTYREHLNKQMLLRR